MPTRRANAVWNGSLTEGNGTMRMASGAFEGPYSFQSRFEEGDGTTPEELIAAAHAGCYSMALSAELGKASLAPTLLRTSCVITLDNVDGAWSITESHLEVTAKVPGASPEAFRKAAEAAETGCPISKLFKTKITMDARLEP